MGNKLTKSSAILMTALTLGVSSLNVTQTVFAETDVIVTAEADAKVDITDKVQSTATIKKGNDNVQANFLYDITITGKPGKVNAGDYVDYKLVNLPVAQLNNRDVTTADGTVIGKLTVVDNQSGTAYNTQNSPKPNTDPVKQALDHKTQAYTSIVRLVFNDKAATLDNISYSFGNTSVGYNPLAAKDTYQFTSSVVSGTKTLTTATSKVAAWTSGRLEDDAYKLDMTYVNKNATGTNMPGTFNVIIPVANKPINAGEQFEVTLNDPAVKFDLTKLKVGTQFTSLTSRGFYTNMNNVNPQGVVINEQQTPTYEVVSTTDNKLVFKVVNAIKPTVSAFTNIPILASPTVDRLNDTVSSFGDIKATVKNLTRNVSKDVSGVSNLIGSNLTADGVKQLRSLTVKYVDATGKEINPQDNSNHNVGFAYTTNAKTIKGYTLKTTPGNAKGTLNNNTTVTYVYDQEVVTTVAPTTTTKVTTKAPTTTVKPATPNNGGNADPASGRNTTTTVTTKAPTTTTSPTTVTTKVPTTTTKATTTTVAPKKITTSFKDPSGKDIFPPTEGDNPKRDIPGYTYVKTTVDPNGNIIHHYEPTKTTTVTPKKVKTYFKDDKGNEVKPPVDGDQPKADIPGYEYVGTETDPDGNVIHKYKKVEATSTKEVKPLPKTGDASSLIGLIGTGLASVIGLVNFKRKK